MGAKSCVETRIPLAPLARRLLFRIATPIVHREGCGSLTVFPDLHELISSPHTPARTPSPATCSPRQAAFFAQGECLASSCLRAAASTVLLSKKPVNHPAAADMLTRFATMCQHFGNLAPLCA